MKSDSAGERTAEGKKLYVYCNITPEMQDSHVKMCLSDGALFILGMIIILMHVYGSPRALRMLDITPVSDIHTPHCALTRRTLPATPAESNSSVTRAPIEPTPSLIPSYSALTFAANRTTYSDLSSKCRQAALICLYSKGP